VVVFECIWISNWRTTTENLVKEVASFTEDLRTSLVSEIENIGKFTYAKTNLSTIGLARVIDSYITNNDTGFTEIQTQVVKTNYINSIILSYYLRISLSYITLTIILCCCCCCYYCSSDRTIVVCSLFNDPSSLTSFVHQ